MDNKVAWNESTKPRLGKYVTVNPFFDPKSSEAKQEYSWQSVVRDRERRHITTKMPRAGVIPYKKAVAINTDTISKAQPSEQNKEETNVLEVDSDAAAKAEEDVRILEYLNTVNDDDSVLGALSPHTKEKYFGIDSKVLFNDTCKLISCAI